MSFLDKIVSIVAPPESDEARHEARRNARAMATPGGWMNLALDHHDRIEAAFASALDCTSEVEAKAAQKSLATLLTAHSIAEEVVLYPALAIAGHKLQAGLAYQEQQTAKVQMAELERLAPLTQEWRDKLEHIRGAVLHHIYEEEKGVVSRDRRRSERAGAVHARPALRRGIRPLDGQDSRLNQSRGGVGHATPPRCSSEERPAPALRSPNALVRRFPSTGRGHLP